MDRALASARRYRWVALAVLLVVWGAGLASAFVQYRSTYESQATIWVLKPSPELTAANPDDPGIPVIQTVASQQSELLDQLISTDSFVRDVVERTSLAEALAAAPDERRFLDTVRKRFKVDTLGTNMFRLSYAGSDPKTPAELVAAALAERTERVLAARALSSAAVGVVYQKEFEAAQQQALAAQNELKQFVDSHPGQLSTADEGHRAQLQLAVDFAQARLSELRGRADRAAVASAVLEMSGLEFQVVDQPRVSTSPRGGEKGAMMTGGIAVMAGLLLAAMLVGAGTLLADHI
ncbi:MAG TPA: hypothetical protein VJQ09_07165, partial [Candidatus Limnocylindria bacterium]|nr:hypothetical protein [Candidatus Limnocylindria bacterium]